MQITANNLEGLVSEVLASWQMSTIRRPMRLLIIADFLGTKQ